MNPDFDSSNFSASQSRASAARQKFRVVRPGETEEHAVGRVLPHSIQAEEGLLACAMMDGADVIARCARAKVSKAAFYVPANRVIFDVLQDVAKRGLPMEVAIVAEELRSRKSEVNEVSTLLDEVGGFQYLARITRETPTTASATYFVERVRELWVLREAIRRGTEWVEHCYAFTGPAVGAHLMPKLVEMQRLVDFADRTARGPDYLLERFRARVNRTLAEVDGAQDKTRWLTWGDAVMDSVFLPLDPNEEDWLVVVGGPPSGGKSSFMRQVAMINVLNGKRGAVFLLETGLRWLEQAACSSVRLNFRQRGEWLKEHRARYVGAVEGIDELITAGRLHVQEDIFHVEDLERSVREINRAMRERDIQSGVPEAQARGLDFIVVDYLQLLDTRTNQSGRMTREQVVATVSRTLKLLLKSLNISGYIGAQINRAGREDANKVPTLRDLRESGAIEQDADRVIFVHTPPVNKAGMPQNGTQPTDEVEIHQRKSRNGPRDVCVELLFDKQFTRYRPREDRASARPGLPKPAGGYGRMGGGL